MRSASALANTSSRSSQTVRMCLWSSGMEPKPAGKARASDTVSGKVQPLCRRSSTTVDKRRSGARVGSLHGSLMVPCCLGVSSPHAAIRCSGISGASSGILPSVDTSQPSSEWTFIRQPDQSRVPVGVRFRACLEGERVSFGDKAAIPKFIAMAGADPGNADPNNRATFCGDFDHRCWIACRLRFAPPPGRSVKIRCRLRRRSLADRIEDTITQVFSRCRFYVVASSRVEKSLNSSCGRFFNSSALPPEPDRDGEIATLLEVVCLLESFGSDVSH